MKTRAKIFINGKNIDIIFHVYFKNKMNIPKNETNSPLLDTPKNIVGCKQTNTKLKLL